MNKRFDELDSLRGLAASSVLLSHLILVLPSIYLVGKLEHTPVHVFWAGHEAVILFFVLSGFVLSLPYYNNKSLQYSHYLIRRVCRIYIPYVVSIVLSIILMSLFSRMGIPGLSTWFNESWTTPLTFTSVINHMTLLGSFKNSNINGVIWSLVQEMRISIIFPFFMYFIIRQGWKRDILLPISIPLLWYFLYCLGIKIFNFDISISKFDSYNLTFRYCSLFILGAVLAKHMSFLRSLYQRLTRPLKLVLICFGVLFYVYQWWFFPNKNPFHFLFIDEWATAIGTLIFIIFSLNSKIFKAILLFKPVHFVGKISYSLYLFHMPVILTFVNVFYGKLPMSVIIVVSAILSFFLASLMYFFVEKPAIKLGKIITKRTKTFQPEQEIIPRRVSTE